MTSIIPSPLQAQFFGPAPGITRIAVHFVMKETRTRQELVISLVVDLLEEKIGKLPFSIKDGRITQLVPLIREQDTAGSQD
jgi:hypothetical protein